MPLNITARLGLDAKGFKAGAEQARQTAGNLKKHVGGQFKAMAAGMAGMFAAAYIGQQMRETIEFTAKVRDLANTFGMTTDHVQKLAYAATQSGIELDVVMDAHKDLGKSMSEALAGVEGKVWAFKALGISVDEIKGKNIDEVFMRVAKAIHESGPILEPDQVKAIEDMMGGAGFQSLNMMRGDLQEIFKTLEEMGGIIDEQAIKKLGELSDRMAAFKTRNQGLWADMMTFFGTAWMKFINYLTASIDVYAERLIRAFNMAKALAALDPRQAGREAQGFLKNPFEEVGKKVAAKEAAEQALIESEKKAKADLAKAAEQTAKQAAATAKQTAADEARKKVQGELAALAEREEKRRFDALSDAEQLLELEAKLAAERLKLTKLSPAWMDEVIEQRPEQRELKQLERKKAEEAVALASAEVEKRRGAAEKVVAPAAMAGEAKFGSLARIGGALGGRNPVLDMAKQQLAVQKENLAAVVDTATAVGVIAGTK